MRPTSLCLGSLLALVVTVAVGCSGAPEIETVSHAEQPLAVDEVSAEDTGCKKYDCDSGCVADSKTSSSGSYGLKCDHDSSKSCQFKTSYTKDKDGLCHAACSCQTTKRAAVDEVSEAP